MVEQVRGKQTCLGERAYGRKYVHTIDCELETSSMELHQETVWTDGKNADFGNSQRSEGQCFCCDQSSSSLQTACFIFQILFYF